MNGGGRRAGRFSSSAQAHGEGLSRTPKSLRKSSRGGRRNAAKIRAAGCRGGEPDKNRPVGGPITRTRGSTAPRNAGDWPRRPFANPRRVRRPSCSPYGTDRDRGRVRGPQGGGVALPIPAEGSMGAGVPREGGEPRVQSPSTPPNQPARRFRDLWDADQPLLRFAAFAEPQESARPTRELDRVRRRETFRSAAGWRESILLPQPTVEVRSWAETEEPEYVAVYFTGPPKRTRGGSRSSVASRARDSPVLPPLGTLGPT